MFTGTVISAGAKGFWFAEQDETHAAVFVHISQVKGSRYLHCGERIRFNLAPNPQKPDKLWAVDVEVIEPQSPLNQYERHAEIVQERNSREGSIRR